MNRQLKHTDIKKTVNKKEIILIAEDLQRPSNYGGLVRTAESFGVKQLWFISDHITKLSPKMRRVSRSAEQNIDIQFGSNALEVISSYAKNGYRSIALEFTNRSVPLHSFKTTEDKVVLICGNENTGVSDKVLEMVQDTINIPVVGTTSSLNVVVATGIALNHLSFY